jgi:adenylate cyclase
MNGQLMKKLTLILSLLFVSAAFIHAQSVADMETKLNKPSTPKSERLTLSYQLAEKLMESNATKAADYAHRASLLASELKDNRREVGATFMSAEATFKKRKNPEAIARFERCYSLAKSYGYNDYALDALKKLSDISFKSGNYREAYRWSQESVTYLSGGTATAKRTTSTSDPYRNKIESQLQLAEADNRKLREELSRITGKSQLLESNYKETEVKLKEVKQETETELDKKDKALDRVSEQKERVDSLYKKRDLDYKSLSREQMESALTLKTQEKEIAEQKLKVSDAELGKKDSENLRNLFGLLAAFVLALAVLLYFRYRAKKKTANDLSAQNLLLDNERKRSDALLLNILPPAIANELRNKNKVAPRKHEQATVMFIDFKGFTTASERLTPEMLVEEIDYCFSNFDRIIGQFRIEKIKTIGDAYMCASGLSDMNASPSDMVKAGLEIQDFLQHLKAERLSRNLPYFEARVGIHTGPVVAGVVGTKKFAYDIWGDTVNIASRLEETCETGKVNVSETAYNLAKYEFDWEHRGKIAAKNKGMIDMYFVRAIKTY